MSRINALTTLRTLSGVNQLLAVGAKLIGRPGSFVKAGRIAVVTG